VPGSNNKKDRLTAFRSAILSRIALIVHACRTVLRKLYEGKKTTTPAGATLTKFMSICPNSDI
jgi:hypothetical protein